MLRTFLKPFSFVPALLLMYMIFSFSAQEGDVSSQLSYNVSVKIIQTADYLFDANLNDYQVDEWANKIHFITRKLGHMAEYFALAIAISFPLYVYGLHGILLMLAAGFLCIGFACGDEYHQSFVAGRSPSAKDVCIDSIGVFFGIILVRIIGWTGRKTIFRPKKKKNKISKKQKKNKRTQQQYEPYPPQYPQHDPYQERQPQYDPYQTPPQHDPYRTPPQYDPYQTPPQYDPYQTPQFQQQTPPDMRPHPIAPHGNPRDPYWQPEKEIDFDLQPEYPERAYSEYNDPYEHDWGFSDPPEPSMIPREDHPPVPHRGAPCIPEPHLPESHTPEPHLPPKKRNKTHKKDWFFDL